MTLIRSVTSSDAAPGDLQAEGADSQLDADHLAFTPTPNQVGGWTGGVLKYVPQASIKLLTLCVRIPEDTFLPNGQNYERTIVDAWNGSTNLFTIRLARTTRGIVTFVVNESGTTYTFSGLGDVCDNVWRKIDIYDSVILINDGVYSRSNPSDISPADRIYLGGSRNGTLPDGNQNRCAPVSIGGVVGLTDDTFPIPQDFVVGTSGIYEDGNLFNDLLFSLETPTTSPVVEGSTITDVVRTNTVGRSMLEVLQELGRTVGGYVYANTDGEPTLARSDASYRGSSQFTITLDEDDDDPQTQTWTDSIDVNPSRVTITFPGGAATAVNTAAESAGAYHDLSLTGACTDKTAALDVATGLLGSDASLWPSSLTVDLVHAQNNLWSALMALKPGTRATIAGLPSTVLGTSSLDVIIQGWSEVHGQSSSKFTFEMTPA